ncbi:hypothetical protein Tco_0486387 [Tanacetum coccineum]
MSSYNQRGCFGCGGPLDGLICRRCTCEWCGNNLRNRFCSFCALRAGNSFVYDPNPNSFNDPPNVFNHPPQPQYETYLYELCGNDSHYGYDCPLQFPLVYEKELSYNQNFGDNYYPQNSPSSQQQYLCCENCGGPHKTFQCQPLNQNFYKPNLCYNSIASGFDQFQPPQFPVIHQPPQEMSIQDMEDLKQQYLDKMNSLINEFPIKDYRDEKIDIKINELKKNFNGMSIEINKKKKLQQLEQVANLSTYPLLFFNSFCYDDDDDDEEEEYTIAITPVLQTEEPDNSLSMGDEHLSTISKTESNELIKSSVENLVPIPSEFEDFSDIEKSMLNRDTLIISSPKFDSLLEEFSGELAHINLIAPGINEADFDPEEEIRLVEKLLYENSSPRPPEEFNYENSNAIIESFSPSPIPFEDRLLIAKVVGDISELYVHVPNVLPTLTNVLFSILTDFASIIIRKFLFLFDQSEPPDDGIYFELDTRVFTKVVDDISDNSTRELYVYEPNVLTTLPHPFSSSLISSDL